MLDRSSDRDAACECLMVCCTVLTSAKMGTVELTGFEMIRNLADGQLVAQALAMSRTMPALVLNRSSLLMPCKKGLQRLHEHKVNQRYC